MAHFAEIDENGIVLRVLVVDDLREHDGAQYLADELGLGGTWIKTSYNTYGGKHAFGGTPLHKNYAGIGYKFDGTGFIPPQPYPSWTLNADSYIWEAPIPMPIDNNIYNWDEDGQEWVVIDTKE